MSFPGVFLKPKKELQREYPSCRYRVIDIDENGWLVFEGFTGTFNPNHFELDVQLKSTHTADELPSKATSQTNYKGY